jgi:hypothetical protein
LAAGGAGATEAGAAGVSLAGKGLKFDHLIVTRTGTFRFFSFTTSSDRD